MWHFQRIDPLHSILPLKYVAFVGAGGKTSLIEYLADRLTGVGKTVAITTTTKIFAREPYHVMSSDNSPPTRSAPVARFGKSLQGDKLTAVDPEDILRLGSMFDTVLIEADGAKRMPLKCPAPYEPVIPSVAEKIFVISGLDALRQKVHEAVFRWELLPNLTGIPGDTVITPDIFISFFSESLLLKGVDMQRCCIVLNKCDTLRQKKIGFDIARGLCRNIETLKIIISSIKLRSFYKISLE